MLNINVSVVQEMPEFQIGTWGPLKEYLSAWKKWHDHTFNVKLVCFVLRTTCREGHEQTGVYPVEKVQGGKKSE